MVKKNSDVRARFAQRLRAIRIPRGYRTARSFAEALQIDENRYTRYERAEVEPDLQLFMKMCSLLDATPNDLLCDTIGAPPVEFEQPYGFAERAASSFNSAPAQQAARRQISPSPIADLREARQAIGYQLAEVIVLIEAEAGGTSPGGLPAMEKLQRTVPLAARITGDAFKFLADLPDRLKGVTISSEREKELDRLVKELVVAHKAGANDNGGG